MGEQARMYQIGEVADRVGLSLRTIRYYEEIGLVVPSGRSPGGFRLYRDEDIERLAYVKHMKPLQFTLEEMRELVELRDRIGAPEIGADERERVASRLKMFIAAADERADALASELDTARAFATSLRRALRRAKAGTRS